MNCQSLQTLLDHGDLGSLSDSEQQAVELHLGECPDCAAAWAVQAEFLAMRIPSTPTGLEERCFGRVARQFEPRADRRRVGPVVIGCLVAGAAAAALVGLLWPRFGDDRNSMPSASIEPVAAGSDATAAAPASTPEIEGVPGSSAATSEAAAESGFTVALTRLGPGDPSPLAAEFNEWFHTAFVAELQRVPNLVLAEVAAADGENAVVQRPIPLSTPFDAREAMALRDRERADRRAMMAATDEHDYHLMVGATLRDNQIAFEVSYAETGRWGTDTGGDALRPGVTATPDQAAGLAAELVEELRLGTFPPDASFFVEFFDRHEARLLDRSASDGERRSALASLGSVARRANDPDLVARYVDGALALAAEAADPSIRERVWSDLRRSDDARLIQPLSDALLYDPNEEVRLAAAETLGQYTDHVVARAVLESAGQVDPSPEVRRMARWLALDDAGRLDDVRGTVLDTSLSDSERLAPLRLGGSIYDIDPGFTLDPVTVGAIAELIQRADDTETRLDIVRRLSMTQSASLVPVYLDRLHSDTFADVRAAAASDLRAHVAAPGVRPALEAAAAGDPAEEVRAAALRVLEAASE